MKACSDNAMTFDIWWPLPIFNVIIIIISQNEMFGDIMVLALPPPVDPDDVNALTLKYSPHLFQILYEGRYPPEACCYWNLILSEH